MDTTSMIEDPHVQSHLIVVGNNLLKAFFRKSQVNVSISEIFSLVDNEVTCMTSDDIISRLQSGPSNLRVEIIVDPMEEKTLHITIDEYTYFEVNDAEILYHYRGTSDILSLILVDRSEYMDPDGAPMYDIEFYNPSSHYELIKIITTYLHPDMARRLRTPTMGIDLMDDYLTPVYRGICTVIPKGGCPCISTTISRTDRETLAYLIEEQLHTTSVGR